jgi:hypothetical protein
MTLAALLGLFEGTRGQASPDIPAHPYDLASCRQDAPGTCGSQLAACRPHFFSLRLGTLPQSEKAASNADYER